LLEEAKMCEYQAKGCEKNYSLKRSERSERSRRVLDLLASDSAR